MTSREWPWLGAVAITASVVGALVSTWVVPHFAAPDAPPRAQVDEREINLREVRGSVLPAPPGDAGRHPAPEAPSPPEGPLASDERQAAEPNPFERASAAYRVQAYDRRWTSEVSASLAETLRDERFLGVSVESVECRTGMCRAVVQGDDATSFNQYRNTYAVYPPFIGGVSTTSYASVDEGGHYRVDILFTRPGERLGSSE